MDDDMSDSGDNKMPFAASASKHTATSITASEADPMESIETTYQNPGEADDAAQFEPQIEDDPLLNVPPNHDEDSLFVPEYSPAPRLVSSHQPTAIQSQNPRAALSHQPTETRAQLPRLNNSVFDKIRNLQAKTANRKKQKIGATIASGRISSKELQTTQTPITDNEKAHLKAVQEFQKKKREYDNLMAQNGRLNLRQDIELTKLMRAEEERLKKREHDRLLDAAEADEEMNLFPEVHNEDSDSAIEMDQPVCTRRLDMPRKEPPPVSIQDAEMSSMLVALEAEEDQPKKKKKNVDPDGANSKRRGKGSKSSKSAKSGVKKARKPRKTAKEKRDAERAILQATSLLTANVFEQQAGQDAPDAPMVRSRRKGDALKEILASVPIGAEREAKSDIAALMAASKDFNGHGAVKPDGRAMWLVRGMLTSLKPYQLLGAAFCRRRENAAEEPRGGLMADQMGLGKTLMMLANIVNGRLPKGSNEPKTTLIVASPALLTQWANEIDQHTDRKIGITHMRYGSGTRPESTNAVRILTSHDIVLTTYTEVMRSYPKNQPPLACQTAEQKKSWWEETWVRARGLLHRIQWQRVVLDEAQQIKNHASRTSIACRALMAKHKWAVSGTPIMNSLIELYPYWRFLCVPHTGNLKLFKANYGDPGNSEHTERLLLRLGQFMLRRTHADTMFGAPILKLPKASENTCWCEFNSIERSIYDIVRFRFVARINVMVDSEQMDKSYRNAFVLLLRLRQLTAHVLMLQFVMRDLLEQEDIERIREVIKNADPSLNNGSARIILAVRKQLDDLAMEKSGQNDAGTRDTPENDAQQESEIGKSFGRGYNFGPYLKSLSSGPQWEATKKKAECSYCHKSPPNDPWYTSCGHLICVEPCLEKSNLEAAERDQEHSTCKACGQTFRFAHPCDEDEDESQLHHDPPTTRSASRKKKESLRVRPGNEDISSDWLSFGGQGVLPSAKTIAVKAQVLNWIRENPNVKIIIYTQFLAMIRILEAVCQEEGWKCEQYHGKLSFKARDEAISNFADNPEIRILLASLRCGGLGLNLTMASRGVILIDLWWNNCTEQQAFCRVFRIGQHEETSMMRLCVRDTVDSRLIKMQQRKKKEIDVIMEDDGSRAKKTTFQDLMRLFGNLQEDDSGRPFIIVDNPDPRGGFRADRDDEGYADEV